MGQHGHIRLENLLVALLEFICTWAMVTKDTGSGDRYDPSIQISTDSGSNYNVRSIAWGHTDVDNDGPIDGTLTQSFSF